MPRPLIPNRPDAILDAAEALVLEHGYERMSVEQVARRAGIGKGAVYREFRSKQELRQALLVRGMRRLVRRVREQAAGTGRVGLATAYRLGVDALLDDPLMTAAFLDDHDVLGTQVRNAPADRYRDRAAWLTGYVEQLHAAGALRVEAPPAAVSLALSAFTIGLLSANALLGPLSRDRLAAAVEVVAVLVEQGLEAPVAGGPDFTAVLDRLDAQLTTTHTTGAPDAR
ncbi:TetR/AcrR family transcriptional regulator [Pseudonocardia sichuanensis]